MQALKINKDILKENIRILAGFFIVSLLYSAVAAALFQLSYAVIIKNALVESFLVFLSGMAVYQLISKSKSSLLTEVFVSYAIGYMLNIVEYFVLMPFGLRNQLLLFSILISVFACFVVFIFPVHGESFTPNIIKQDIPFLVIFLIYWGLTLFAYSTRYLSPAQLVIPIHRDLQYWVNNTNALAIQFPASNLFMSDYPLFYHYFSSIHLAFQNIVSGIDTFTLSFSLFAETSAILFFGSIYFLMKTCKATNKVAIISMIILLFTTGYEASSIITYLHHTLLAPFGFNIGFAFGALFLGTIILQFNSTKFNWTLFFGSILFWAGCVGSKGPISMTLMAIPAVFCLVWLFQKQYKKCFVYGFSIVLIFLLITVFCEGLFNVFGNVESLWKISIYSAKDIFTQQTVKKILLANPILLCFYSIMFIKLIISWTKKKVHSALLQDTALFVSATLGGILWISVNAGGSSEMYFLMGAYIPIVASIPSTVTWLNSCLSEVRITLQVKRKLKTISVALLFSLMLVGIYNYCFNSYDGEGALSSSFIQTSRILNKNNSGTEATQSVSLSDYEALAWIRDNTPVGSMIVADRAIMTADRNYYYYGMFSQRQMYLEGTSMMPSTGKTGLEIEARMKQIISVFSISSNKGLLELKEQGVDYLVQTTAISPSFIANESLLKHVFSSDSINVYEIK